jgi:hypothetical protein
MVFALVTALTLAAPPPPPPLGEISAPLGHIGNVVDAPPKGGVSDSDKVVVPQWEGCQAQGVYLMRFLGGSARALEQLQQSLDRGGADAEKRLFGRKGVLGEVMKQLGSSRFESRVPASPSALADGYRLELTAAPRKWSDAPPGAAEGEYWFFAQGKPAAVVSLQRGAPDACKPRLSTVLFDARGTPRVRLHADWGGALSASLIGERCQAVEYSLQPERQVFSPLWKSCKR